MSIALDDYRLLGESGLRVSPVCLGTQTFGTAWGYGRDKEGSRELFEFYRERGGNFIDTADVYNCGTSEEYLGEFLKGQRDHFVVSTKYTCNTDSNDPNAGGNHLKNMKLSLESSLKNLHTDYIDLFWIHAWDHRTPIEEVMRGLDGLIRQGKILHIGFSNAPAWKVSEANTLANLRGWAPFCAVQIQYNLLERNAERALIPMALEKNVAVLSWSPLAGGVLAGIFGEDALKEESSSKDAFDPKRTELSKQLGMLTAANLDKVHVIKEIADEIERAPAQVALNWLLQKPGLTCPIVGAYDTNQLKENIGSLEFSLSDEHMAQLDILTKIDMGFEHYFSDENMYNQVIDGGLNIEKSFTPGKKKLNGSNRTRIKFKKKYTEEPLLKRSVYFTRRVAGKLIRSVDPDLENLIKDHLYFKRLKRNSSDLIWKPLRRSPDNRLDAGRIQCGHELFAFGGYQAVDHVLSYVDVLDLKTGKWKQRFAMPEDMAQTHLGLAYDGKRYIYAVSGQLGDQCAPATAKCFVLDTETKTWDSLPPLPEPRYAPAVELWQGRLHSVGGAKEDRFTPADDHWSIAVEGGKAVEGEWRRETSIPKAGMHRVSAVIDNKFFVLGGQQGDYVAVPGDPKYTGMQPPRPEVIFGDSYMLETPGGEWQKIADMPIPVSQVEFSSIQLDHHVAVVGGMTDNDPDTHIFELSDSIQIYDAKNDTWTVTGKLPYRVKSTLAAYHDGWLYMATGQRDRGSDDPQPGDYESRVWRTKFSLDA